MKKKSESKSKGKGVKRSGIVVLLRKGGVHEKSKSSKRQKAKRDLKKQLDAMRHDKDFDQASAA